MEPLSPGIDYDGRVKGNLAQNIHIVYTDYPN
jgi:hypothetical protein